MAGSGLIFPDAEEGNHEKTTHTGASYVEARKEEKNEKTTLCKTCFFRGLPSLGAWSFVGGGPQAAGQRTPFSESLVCFLSLTEFEILFEGSRQCPWCMHRARVLGVKPAGERYALKKVAQLRKEKDVLAM